MMIMIVTKATNVLYALVGRERKVLKLHLKLTNEHPESPRLSGSVFQTIDSKSSVASGMIICKIQTEVAAKWIQ